MGIAGWADVQTRRGSSRSQRKGDGAVGVRNRVVRDSSTAGATEERSPLVAVCRRSTEGQLRCLGRSPGVDNTGARTGEGKAEVRRWKERER